MSKRKSHHRQESADQKEKRTGLRHGDRLKLNLVLVGRGDIDYLYESNLVEHRASDD